MYYTVQPGDTLFSIAARYGVSVNALMQANNLSSFYIYVGQTLRIPVGAGSPGGTPPYFPPGPGPSPSPVPPPGPGPWPGGRRLEERVERLEREVDRLQQRVRRLELQQGR